MSFRSIAARAGHAAGASSCRGLNMAPHATALSPFRVRPLSTEAKSIKELPGDEDHDVVFETKYGVRSITLNRPKKLNSLNASMIRKIVPRMVQWEQSDMANVIVLKGAGEKSLCAGGDVTALAEANRSSEDGWKKSAEYFGLEYKLDHYISTYQKPYIAFMDGITMGGGVGLSIHAPFRIATERTVFAMPETTIGFFPDVGASFFLPRMNGAVGTYLALTSERLSGVNVLYSGVATHYLHSSTLPEVEARLAEIRFSDTDDMNTRLRLINGTLEEFVTGLPYDQPMQIAGEVRKAIDRCFSKDSVDEIIAALKAETGPTEEWAQKQLATMQKRSPTAVHVTLRQMRSAQDWDIAQTFKREAQIATQFMKHPDFSEGVTALLVRKQKPSWQPATLDDVKDSKSTTDAFFEYDEANTLDLFTDRTYAEYPYPPELSMPSERDFRRILKAKQNLTPSQLAKAVVEIFKRRQGVHEIVEEIMARKIVTNEAGHAQWAYDEFELAEEKREAQKASEAIQDKKDAQVAMGKL
ncbi:enoyl-CoA hydratase/isomerase [Emericellopsis atlantica]|uniref:3-hydroxyisobutyryl-CoA hydrolase n=1 Tax=Emericellopsis atlantica TaxID=2614577 RepID=A0A9P7ZPP2_9HYPO|nr:enoyl-CoA hydratase/isomerase [Emericellopsis atlantica]KAG9255440.1 enoyl-CoA hydratase/isomerase [Emericellopsis atlantica]